MATRTTTTCPKVLEAIMEECVTEWAESSTDSGAGQERGEEEAAPFAKHGEPAPPEQEPPVDLAGAAVVLPL
jgi:hypothetical protein